MTLSALIGLVVLLGLIALAGAGLSRLSRPSRRANAQDDSTTDKDTNVQLNEQLIERVNAALPQTQCAQCGYPGCRPYASAIINDDERINRCPPGGTRTISDLAELLGTPIIALDSSCGEEKPAQVAVIDEAVCIGCTLCIHACPVDAIVGAGKLMHTVIEDECTGCELCLPPCPVDCIDLVTLTTTAGNWSWPKPA